MSQATAEKEAESAKLAMEAEKAMIEWEELSWKVTALRDKFNALVAQTLAAEQAYLALCAKRSEVHEELKKLKK